MSANSSEIRYLTPVNVEVKKKKYCRFKKNKIKFKRISATESKYRPVYEGVFFKRANSPSAASKIDFKIKKNPAME